MEAIFDDLSPGGMTAAIEQNYMGWLPILAKLGQYHEDSPRGVRRVCGATADPLFNSVMDARLTPEDADAAIETIIEDLRARNVPGWWWVGPSTQPADLGERLVKHGFTLQEEVPAMALDLAQLQADLPCPEGLSIEPGPEALSENPGEVEQAWHRIYAAETETMHLYRGMLDGKQVAGSMLLRAAGVAGVYAVWVNKDYRRRGIGTWMTLHALLEARRMGYRAAVLQSSELGFGVYRALGFQEYFKVQVYLWKPEEKAQE